MRLATSPSRGFLNSTFNETPTSRAQNRGRPEVMIHPDDAGKLGIADGAEVVIGNTRGQVRLHARVFDGVRRGVLIAESIWPNDAYPDGRGINTVTGADAIAPYGGAAFHDNKVWIRPAGGSVTELARAAGWPSIRQRPSAIRCTICTRFSPRPSATHRSACRADDSRPAGGLRDRCGARPRARAPRAPPRCRRLRTGTAACAMIGPESISGTTKCTVAPCSFAPAASARAWVSRPLNAGSSAGWMLRRRPSHCRTNHGVKSRMKPGKADQLDPVRLQLVLQRALERLAVLAEFSVIDEWPCGCRPPRRASALPRPARWKPPARSRPDRCDPSRPRSAPPCWSRGRKSGWRRVCGPYLASHVGSRC